MECAGPRGSGAFSINGGLHRKQGGQNFARTLPQKPLQATHKDLVRNAPAQAGRLPLKTGKNHRPPLQPTRLTSALKIKCIKPFKTSYPDAEACTAGKDMPSRPPPKTSCALPGKPLPGRAQLVLMQGNASLQAGSPALQQGYAKSASPGFHSGQPAFAALKLAPPSPRSPGETF
jgi:hypothetical protein